MLFHLQTNDVNQGDALEHDFSTLHSALVFPIKRLDAIFSQVTGLFILYRTVPFFHFL